MSILKDTEFGIVATDWNYIPSLEFCTKITDGTHDSPKQQKEGKHLVTSKHIKGRNIDFETAYLISPKDFNSINLRSKVDQWDVIVSMIGEYCGFTYVERNVSIDYAVKNVGLFKTGSEHKALWLYYYLNSKIGRHILEINKSGTSQPYLTLGFLRELPILYPPSIDEANQIIKILSSLDDKIDLLHRQNKTLEQLAETLFRQWFVEEAEESEFVRLGEVVKTSSGGTPSRSKMEYYQNGTIKWVKSKELQGSFIFDTEEKVTDEAVKNSSAKLFPVNTILIAMYGATVGEYAILAEPATCNQAVCGLIPNIDFPYTFLFILTKYNKENLIGLAGGSAQQNISQELIKAIEIPNSIEKIKDYHKITEPNFQKIKSNQAQIRTLTQTRDILLPKLMSGEVRGKN
jgi:type I restriction enzyme S subunit